MQSQETKSNARQVRAGIHGAWAWWIAELAAMIPAALKQSLMRPEDFDFIYIDDSNVSVRHFDGFDSDEVLRTSLDQIDEDRTAKHEAAIVALSPAVAFTGRYKIPAVPREKLRQAVALEVSRRSPFRSASEFFDFIVVGNQDNGKILDIEWATAPSELISKAQAVAQKLGYVPAAIGIAPDGDKKLKFTFARQSSALGFRLRSSAKILLLSIFLFLGALAYSAYDSLDQAQTTNAKIADLKQESEDAQKVQATADAVKNAVKLIAQRAAEPKILDILRATTDALPDGTWVSEFNLNGNQLRLAGYSTSASSLPELLTNVPLFLHPQFRAPITPQANAQGDKTIDHFDIGLTINNRHAEGEAN